jgi:hypothetical protein|tara:strand:- start:188 stop:463 length:276 start_codon:yes stop_codon:yes gene_type:complete
MASTLYLVNIYGTGRAYGGPEEGGWYYDYRHNGETVMAYVTLGLARYVADCINTTGRMPSGEGGELNTRYCEALVEEHAPRDYPPCRPHYE